MDLHRETLFEQVWSTPMSHLCKTYGVSDQALRKSCVKLQIPVPQRGHWAKIAAGHKIDRPDLPPFRPTTDRSSKRPRISQEPPSSAKETISTPTAEIKATLPLTGPFHSSIRSVVAEYTVAEKEALQLKAKFDWEREHPGRAFKGVAPQFGSWEYFCDNGKVLRPTHKKSFMRVSLLTYKRAFRLLQAVIERLEGAGFSVDLANGRERLKATRDSIGIDIRLAEKLEVGQRKEFSSWSKEPRFVRTLSPTGRLVIDIAQVGLGTTQVADRFDHLLEQQLDTVMEAVEYRYQRSAETLKEWERQRQESAERERVRQEELRLREAKRRAEEAEQVKRRALVQEAKDWNAAETLRAYLSHLEHRFSEGGRPMEGYIAWRAWAVEVANELDPSYGRVGPCSGQARQPESSPHEPVEG